MSSMDLLKLARQGDLDGVKEWIRQGIRVNTTNGRSNQTALYFACENGKTEVAQYLLDRGASLHLGAKPLIAAVRHKHYDCVKLLLQRHANVNCFNTKGESPFSIAVQKRYYSIILLLVQYGATPSESLKNMSFKLVKHAKSEHAPVIIKLIDKSVITLTTKNVYLAAFGYSFKRGILELAKRMLSLESYENMKQLYPVAMYYSAKNNWSAILLTLIGKQVDVNVLTKGETPLYVACKEGHEAVVDLLLNNGADPNVPNTNVCLTKVRIAGPKEMQLPVQVVILQANVAIFNMLVKKGANLHQAHLLHLVCSPIDELKVSDAQSRATQTVLSMVRLLLEHGVAVNAISDKGDTALYRACRRQQLEVVQALLEAGTDVNLTTRSLYPLIAACETGNAELFYLMLNAGADVNCNNVNDETCIHILVENYTVDSGKVASTWNVVSAIKSLVERGINVNAHCLQKETALYRASKAGHENIVRLLLQADARTRGTRSRRPLYAACEHGHTQIVDLLLRHGADSDAFSQVSQVSNSQSTLGLLPICCAIKKGYTDIANKLLQNGADVNKQESRGKSALIYVIEHLTSHSNHIRNLALDTTFDILKSMLLVGRGAGLNLPSATEGLNPLHIATVHGRCDIMSELIHHGADCSYPTDAGYSAVDLACGKDHESAMELLLKNGAKPAKPVTGSMKTSASSRIDPFDFYLPLHEFTEPITPALCNMAKKNNEKMVKKLLEHGADVNTACEDGNTALHLTTSSSILDTLLKAGANVYAVNDRGESALSKVCLQPETSVDVVEMLLTYCADPNIDFPLSSNHIHILQLLLNSGADPNLLRLKDDEGIMKTSVSFGIFQFDVTSHGFAEPALCRLAKNNNATMVKMLLDHGADVNIACEDGSTALHLTTSCSIIETLLTAGANANVVNNDGETVLSKFCSQSEASVDVVEMLLKFDADPNLRFHLSEACKTNNVDIVQLLLKYGADPNRPEQRTVVTPVLVSEELRTYVELDCVQRAYPSALCIACSEGNLSMVDCLLQSGASTGFTDTHGNTPLHFAVKRLEKQTKEGHDPIIALLLNHSAPVNAVSNEEETPLYLACTRGLVGIVKQLIDCKVDINPTNSGLDKNPLLVACERKFTDIAMMLLNYGADPNVCIWPNSYKNQTPLKVATSNGDVELVKELLSHGAAVNQMHDISNTALHEVVVSRETIIADGILQKINTEHSINIIRMLLKNSAEPNALNGEHETPLYLAFKQNGAKVNLDIIKTLLEHGADPNLCPPSSSADSSNRFCNPELPPLAAAVRCSQYTCNTELMTLLIKFGARLDDKDSAGKTALHHAVGCAGNNETLTWFGPIRGVESNESTSDTAAAEVLLLAGAEVNALDKSGASPLYWACRGGKTEFVKLLLSHNADPNLGTLDGFMYPIHAACKSQCCDIVKLLLETSTDVSVRDTSGKTILHHMLEDQSNEDNRYIDSDKTSAILHLLLDKAGRVINTASQNRETPLYIACSKGLLSIVAMLLDYGANVNADIGEKLPVNAACSNKHLAVVQLLMTKGANPNPNIPETGSKLPLVIAAAGGSSQLVELLLKYGANINAVDADGNTPLHHAIENSRSASRFVHKVGDANSDKSVTDILLQNNADVNAENNSAETALYTAVSEGLQDVVERMLKAYGGNPNKASPDKNPLTVACEKRTVQFVDILLKHGADPNVGSTSCGPGAVDKFPLSVAVENGRDEIVMSLLNVGARVNAMNSKGKSILCIAVEKMTSRSHVSYFSEPNVVRMLMEHGADVNSLMPDGRSQLHLVVSAFKHSSGSTAKSYLTEIIQLSVKCGAILCDSLNLGGNSGRQPCNIQTVRDLTTFDSEYQFILDLFRGGAGFSLLGFCCNAVASRYRWVKSIRLCQAAVLAGYKPNAQELQDLQQEVASQRDVGGLVQQLLDWLNEDRQQVPSLQRQCRVAIRRQLSTAASFRTIFPAIEKLPLPVDLKLYLQFEGPMTDIDLIGNDVNRTCETSTEKTKHRVLLSTVLDSDDSDSDNDYLW